MPVLFVLKLLDSRPLSSRRHPEPATAVLACAVSATVREVDFRRLLLEGI